MRTAAQRLSTGLGWMSAGLGVTSLLAPGRVARLVGLRETPGTRRAVRAVGLQELSAAGGIFTMGRPSPAMWSRVAGDALHLSLVGRALRRREVRASRALGAVGALAGVTALDAYVARRLTKSEPGTLRASAAVTVNRTADDAYTAWRDLERLPDFMTHLAEVRVTADGRSHWVADGPAGTTIEWMAEIVDDVPGKRLSWRSVEPSAVTNSGTVRFTPAPGGDQTEVSVELKCAAPAGGAGATVAKLFGEEPQQQLRDDLRRFKQCLETGEVLRSDGSPAGTRTQNQWQQEEAKPKGDVA